MVASSQGSCSSLGKGHSYISVSEASTDNHIEHSRLQFFESLVAPQEFDQGYLHLQVGQMFSNARSRSSAEAHISHHHQVRILETRIFVSVRTELRGRVEVFRVEQVGFVHVVNLGPFFDRYVCDLQVLRGNSVEQEPRRGAVESVRFLQNSLHELELFDGGSSGLVASSDVLIYFFSDFLKNARIRIKMVYGGNNETCRGVLSSNKEDVHFLEEDFFHVGRTIQVLDHKLDDVLRLVSLTCAFLDAIVVDVLADGLHEDLLGGNPKVVKSTAIFIEIKGSCLVPQKKHQGMEAHSHGKAVKLMDCFIQRLTFYELLPLLHAYKQGNHHLAEDTAHHLEKVDFNTSI